MSEAVQAAPHAVTHNKTSAAGRCAALDPLALLPSNVHVHVLKLAAHTSDLHMEFVE